MLRARLFREEHEPQEVSEADWEKLPKNPANLLWVDLESPTDDDLKRVAQIIELDPRAAAILRDPQKRPLVRVYKDHFVVTAVTAALLKDSPLQRIERIEVDLLVARKLLVSVHEEPLPFADELSERTATNPKLGAFDASSLLYVVIDTLLDHFSQLLDTVEEQAERLEDRLLMDTASSRLRDVGSLKRRVRLLRRVLSPHQESLTTLISPDSPLCFLEETDPEPFRELAVRVDALLLRLDHIREIVGGAYDLYISNMSHRTNQQLKVLTYLSAVLLPMTVISGLFGTNFKLAEYDASQPFYVMLAGMAILAVLMVLFFRWKRWL
jgi:magnesium transporter